MGVVMEDPTAPPPLDSRRTTHNTTVIDAEYVLRAELFKNVYVNVPNLIDTMFGGPRIEQLVAKVYDGLVNDGILAKDAESLTSKTPPSSPWKGLSPNPSTENEIYEPLCAILNAITKVTREHDQDALGVVWRDEHAHNIQSDFLEALRPDIVATFAPEQDNGTTTEDCAWWRLVHTPMEIKKRFGGKAAMLQLFNYVRQTLKEQPDRRFVFGLLFSRNCLTVWLADRTGVLGSSAFNIHTDPKRLIAVIVGLLVKKPSELGWDPTMLAYVEDEDGRPMDPVPSYRLPRTKKADKSTTTAYHRKWVVEMNAPGQEDQNNPKMERFLLFRAVSLSHAEVIRGRSTRIWLAWKWDDVLDSKFTKETRKVYVFKDSWRDQRREQEGKLYAIACKGRPVGGVALVHSYGTVKVHGKVDETLKLIRGAVKPGKGDKPLHLLWDQLSGSESLFIENEDNKKLPAINAMISHIFEESIAIPRNRIHSRLVMSTSGWPLTKFKSLEEFAGALHDVVAGHKHLCDNDVLHRDLAYNNILITGLPAPNRGVLIDLDYAIHTVANRQVLADDELSGTLGFMSFEVLSSMPYTFSSGESDDDADSSFEVDGSDSETEDAEEQVKHRPIHDLEGLFWVTCYICMSREGPARSLNLLQESVTPEQQKTLKCLDESFLFEDVEHMKAVKSRLMENPKTFKQNILVHFYPYFKPLLGMARFLYKRLRHAYRTRAFTGIHDRFLTALKKVSETPVVKTWHESAKHRKYLIMEREEERRRREDRGNWEITPQRAPTERTTTLPSIPEGSSELDAITESSQDEPLPSSARPGKRRKLNDSSAAAAGIRRSTRLSSAPRVPVRAETPSPSERSRKRKRQSLGDMAAGSNGSIGGGRRGGGSGGRGGSRTPRGGHGRGGGMSSSLPRTGQSSRSRG